MLLFCVEIFELKRSFGKFFGKKATMNAITGNLPEMPPLRVWSALRYAHRWAFAELGTVVVIRQSLVSGDLNETPTAGYGLLNIKLGATYRKLSAGFTIDNLLNRFYYEHLSYYRDPFATGVKVPEPGRKVVSSTSFAPSRGSSSICTQTQCLRTGLHSYALPRSIRLRTDFVFQLLHRSPSG